MRYYSYRYIGVEGGVYSNELSFYHLCFEFVPTHIVHKLIKFKVVSKCYIFVWF